MNPLISVIVPVYKVEQYLDECVQSIINQTYKNLEIILVDDGSPDRCPEMCDEYARQDSRIKVIHKPNGGISSARNSGLDIARGEYVGFVDSDDYIAHDMYEKLYKAFEGTENVFVVKCKYKRISQSQIVSEEWTQNKTYEIITPDNYLLNAVLENFSPKVWDMLIQRKHISVRFSEGKLAEDYFFNYLLGYYAEEHELSLKQIPDELYVYRDTEGSYTNDNLNLFSLFLTEMVLYMYHDAINKGRKELAGLLYARSASQTYELNMLMASNPTLKQRYYSEYHRRMFDYDWPILIKRWGLRHKLGLVLALYLPQLLSFSCVRYFVTKRGTLPPWT